MQEGLAVSAQPNGFPPGETAVLQAGFPDPPGDCVSALTCRRLPQRTQRKSENFTTDLGLL
jgi:hypothetical protein